MKRSSPLARKTPLARTSRKQRQKDALHSIWRLILLYRQGWHCRAEGRGTVSCGGPLQGHHIYPKGTYPRLRYDLDNGVIVCRNHHLYWLESGGAVHETGAWLVAEVGEAELARLSIKAQASRKSGKKIDLKAERIYLELELDDCRKGGSHEA